MCFGWLAERLLEIDEARRIDRLVGVKAAVTPCVTPMVDNSQYISLCCGTRRTPSVPLHALPLFTTAVGGRVLRVTFVTPDFMLSNFYKYHRLILGLRVSRQNCEAHPKDCQQLSYYQDQLILVIPTTMFAGMKSRANHSEGWLCAGSTRKEYRISGVETKIGHPSAVQAGR